MKVTALFLFLLLAGCGSQTSDLKIVGGKQTYRSWYGRMEVGGQGRCGSTLIDPNRQWVITAQHCLPGVHKDRIKIRLGAYDANSRNNGGRAFELLKVTKIVEHPSQDLALMKLERRSKFRPIGFANKKFPDGYSLYAFGFGDRGWGLPGDGKLKGVVLRHRLKKNPAGHMIYTDGSTGQGVCHGDSGGPLIDPKSRKLVGITSWTGSRCASVRGIDGFVRPDMNWIKRVIKKKR